jgi:hypothetical protein
MLVMILAHDIKGRSGGETQTQGRRVLERTKTQEKQQLHATFVEVTSHAYVCLYLVLMPIT